MSSHNHTTHLTLSCMMLFMLASYVSSDVAKDRDECASQLVGLATCLPYVGGTAKAPTPDCCNGLKQILGSKNRKCLCVLVRDRNDPQLGLKINATLALGLPSTCHAPSNASECPALLGLAPHSPDAQVFEQFANSTKGATAPDSNGKGTAANSTNSAPNEKSGGSSSKRWLGANIVAGVVLCVVFGISS